MLKITSIVYHHCYNRFSPIFPLAASVDWATGFLWIVNPFALTKIFREHSAGSHEWKRLRSFALYEGTSDKSSEGGLRSSGWSRRLAWSLHTSLFSSERSALKRRHTNATCLRELRSRNVNIYSRIERGNDRRGETVTNDEGGAISLLLSFSNGTKYSYYNMIIIIFLLSLSLF